MNPSTLTLVLDSSSPTLFLGLIQHQRVLGHHVEKLDRQHSELMLPRLIQFLNRFGFQLKDVTDVVVGHGPGSFTGVRLGLTLIKTLALMQPLKVFPISSLHLFAFEPHAMVTLDARGGRQYVGVYKGNKIIASPQIIFEKDLPAFQLLFSNIQIKSMEEALQHPKAILDHLLEILSSLDALQDIQTLNPLYLKELV